MKKNINFFVVNGELKEKKINTHNKLLRWENL